MVNSGRFSPHHAAKLRYKEAQNSLKLELLHGFILDPLSLGILGTPRRRFSTLLLSELAL